MSVKSDLILSLEFFRKRKSMYLTSVSLNTVENYLTGFMGAIIATIPQKRYPNDIIQEVGSEFGYPKCSLGPVFHIRKSSLSEDKQCDELILIYEETIRRLI